MRSPKDGEKGAPKDDEKGAAAILVAASLLFLLGMAAIAVDVSGFYQDARVGQTTADMACLAGVADLPGDAAAAFTHAGAYAKANWPEMTGITMNVAGDTGTIDDGAGNVITLQTPVGGDPEKMKVTIVDRSPTFFGRVFGAQSVDIRQEATCARAEAHGGPPLIPLAALPGLFGGDLFDCASKVTGNCGAIDSGSGANDFRDAIANGIEAEFEKHHGNWSSPDPDTGRVGTECSPPDFPSPCNADKTETGNMVGPFDDGVTTRLSDVSDATCIEPGPFNCDNLFQVIGSVPGTLDSEFGAVAPPWWEPSIYGSYTSAKAVQYYWNGDIDKCDSPRMATVPIVAYNDDWDVGDAAGTWPNGKKRMKFIGFYSVFIREPDHYMDTFDHLGGVVADVVWFGPDATCDGVPFDPFGGETIPGGVKLVAG